MKLISFHLRWRVIFCYLYFFLASLFTPLGVWQHLFSHANHALFPHTVPQYAEATAACHEKAHTETLCLVCVQSVVFQSSPLHYTTPPILFYFKSFFEKRTDSQTKKFSLFLHYAARAPPFFSTCIAHT